MNLEITSEIGTQAEDRKGRVVRLIHPDSKEKDVSLENPKTRMITQELYEVSGPNYIIDLSSMLLLTDPTIVDYLMMETKESYIGMRVWALIPLNEHEKKLYEEKEYNPSYIPVDKNIAGGTYGKVSHSLSQNIVIKQSNMSTTTISADMIKEIAFYRMIESDCSIRSRSGSLHHSCVPELKGFSAGLSVNDSTILPSLAIERGSRIFYDDIYKLETRRTERLGIASLVNQGKLPERLLEKSDEIYSRDIKRVLSHFFTLISCMYSISNIGLIHCDLKPHNVIIGKDGVLRIIDWGMAEYDPAINFPRKKDYVKQTMTFACPEILLKKTTYDYKADVFSIGIMILDAYRYARVRRMHNSSTQRINWIVQELIGQYDLSDEPAKLYLSMALSSDDSTKEMIKERLMSSFLLEEDISDLISEMVAINPKERMTWPEIMNHSLFKKIGRREVLNVSLLPSVFPNDFPITPNIEKYYGDSIQGVSPRDRVTKSVFRACIANTSDSPLVLCLAIQIADLFMIKGGFDGNPDYERDWTCLGISAFLLAHAVIESSGYEITHENVKLTLGNNVINFERATVLQYQVEILVKLNGNIITPTFYTYFSRIYGYHPVFNRMKGVTTGDRKEYMGIMTDCMLIYKKPDVYSISMLERVMIESKNPNFGAIYQDNLISEEDRKFFFQTFSKANQGKPGGSNGNVTIEVVENTGA